MPKSCKCKFQKYIQFRWVPGMLWCSSTILLHSITKSVYIQVNILPLMLHFLRQNISTESPTMKWFNENIFQYLRHMFEITWIMERGIKKTIMLSPPKPQSQRDMTYFVSIALPEEILHFPLFLLFDESIQRASVTFLPTDFLFG